MKPWSRAEGPENLEKASPLLCRDPVLGNEQRKTIREGRDYCAGAGNIVWDRRRPLGVANPSTGVHCVATGHSNFLCKFNQPKHGRGYNCLSVLVRPHSKSECRCGGGIHSGRHRGRPLQDMLPGVRSCRDRPPCLSDGRGERCVPRLLLGSQPVELVALLAQNGKYRKDWRTVGNKSRLRPRAQSQMKIDEVKAQPFLPGL